VNAYLLVALGGALGSVARHWCSLTMGARFGAAFPWGTIIVNIVGSFAIGVLAALLDADTARVQSGREFLMVGVLGGYTTFSAFSLQTLTLLREEKIAWAAANVVVSVVACLVAVALGYFIARFARVAV
jgi:CrcB protein